MTRKALNNKELLTLIIILLIPISINNCLSCNGKTADAIERVWKDER